MSVLAHDDLWPARAAEHRRFRNYCELCEKRNLKIWFVTFRAQLQVHHRRGRGAYRPVGFELVEELITLCVKHHQRITRQHQAIARARGVFTKDAFGNDTREYADIIAAVTAEAEHWIGPKIARGVRQMLRDRP